MDEIFKGKCRYYITLLYVETVLVPSDFSLKRDRAVNKDCTTVLTFSEIEVFPIVKRNPFNSCVHFVDTRLILFNR